MTGVVCSDCGTDLSRRQHVVADFLIGAHAAEDADELLTLDGDFHRSYFDGLEVRP